MTHADILIDRKETVREALKRLDKAAEKVLLVINEAKRLLGTITDGDIRRYILNGKSLDNNLDDLYNRNPIFIMKEDYSLDKVRDVLMTKVSLIPILDHSGCVVDYVSRRRVLSPADAPISQGVVLDTPVVIMAGGMGTRLEPFSKIFPKPLMPIGEKPMVEIVIDEFRKQGIREYYLTINHKGAMVESYFNHIDKDYKIHFVREDEFYGTAGSLKLLEKDIGDLFIVSNCDIIVKANFGEAIAFHKEQKAVMTVLSAIQHFKIPYGIINFKEGGEVINIHEKLEYTLTVNAGVYILNRACLEFIPERSHFDMTDLMKILIKSKRKISTYPVNENDYIDMGQWEEYKKTINKVVQ